MDAARQWPAAREVLTEAERGLSETTPAPLAASIRLLAATVHERLGNPDQALLRLDSEAMTSDATRAQCLALRALCLVQTGETVRAREEFATATALEHDSHAVHALLAWVILGLGDAGAAAVRAAEGVRRYPDSHELPFLGCQAEIAAGGDIDKQVHPLSKLVARMHRADLDVLVERTRRVRSAGGTELDASVHYFLAVVARAAGDADDARAAAGRAIARLAAVPAPARPGLTVAVRRLRAELLETGDPAAAAADFAAAANEALELGDWAGTVELFTAALRIGSLDQEDRWKLAEAHYLTSSAPSASLGVMETAIREAQRIWDSAFEAALPDVIHGWIYVARGRIEMGLAHLEDRFPVRALRTMLYCESALMLGAAPTATAELHFGAAHMLGLYAVGADVQEQVLREAPSDVSILDRLLTCACNAGDVARARMHLPQLVRATGHSGWREAAGRLQRLAGDPQAALDELVQVAEARRSSLYFRWLEFVASASLGDAEGVSRALDAARAYLDTVTPDGTDAWGQRYTLGLQVVFTVLLGRREAAHALLEGMADDDSWWSARFLEAALAGLLGPDIGEHEAAVRRFIEHTPSYEDVMSVRTVLRQLRRLVAGWATGGQPNGPSPDLDAALERLDRLAEERLAQPGWPATIEGDLNRLRRLASASDAEPDMAHLASLAELAIRGRRALEARDWPAAIDAYRALAADGGFPEAEIGLIAVAARSAALSPGEQSGALAEVARMLADAVPAIGGNRRRSTAPYLLETWIADLHLRLGDLPAAWRMYESAVAVAGEWHARHVVIARLYVGGALRGRTDVPGLEEVLHACGTVGTPAQALLLGVAEDLARTPDEWERLARLWEHASSRVADVGSQVAMLAIEATARAGQAWRGEGDLDRAQALLRRAYERHRDVAGPDDPDVLVRRAGLAEVLRELGRIADAVDELRAVVDVRARVVGLEDETTVAARFDLGVALLDLGSATEAEAELRRAAESRARLAGPDAVETWDARYRHAMALQAADRLDEASGVYREVLEADERLFGSDSVRALETRFQIADVQAVMERLEEAAHTFQEVVAGRVRSLGEEDPSTLAARLARAQTLRLQGRSADAQELTTLVETCTRVLGEDDETTLAARFEAGVALQEQGMAAAAEETFADLHQRCLRILGENNTTTWDIRYRLGVAVQLQGRLAEAEQIYRSVLAAELRVREPLDPSTLVTQHQIALVVSWQGRLTEAESELRTVIAGRTQVLGPDDPETLAARHELAFVLQKQERLDEARDELVAVVAGRERAFGPDAPDTHLTRIDLGEVRDQLDEDAAVEELRTAAEGLTRTCGPDHPDTLMARSTLATMLLGRGEPHQAEVEFRALADGRARSLGEDDLRTWAARYNVAFAQQQQGEWRAAEQTYGEVLAAETRLQGGEDPSTLDTRVQLAFALRSQGKFEEAAEEQRVVIEARRRALGPTDPTTLSARSELGSTLLDMNLPREAAAEFREVADAMAATLGLDDLRTWLSRYRLATALEEQEELDAAEREYREVLAAETRLQGGEDPSTLVTHYRLAVVLFQRGQYADAEAELHRVVAGRIRALGEADADTFMARYRLALTIEHQKRYAEAERLYRELLTSETELHGADHPNTLFVGHWLGQFLFRQDRHAAAVDVLRDIVDRRSRVLGPVDRGTLNSRLGLAASLAGAGELRAAEEEYRALIADQIRALGEADSETLATREEFASLLRRLGNTADADAELKAVERVRAGSPGSA
jgi:tetratricopeptide (TPR) repeat protein